MRRSWVPLLAFALLLPATAAARYAMALGYQPKYPRGFDHFDYVNPNAPKGGAITLSAFGSFESLNPFLLKSQSPRGLQELVFETLMVRSKDEPFTMYGLLADDIQVASDGLSVTFHLNPKARFSNGDPVLARDVKRSFDLLTGSHAHPRYRLYWRDVRKAIVVSPRRVRFEFRRRNPELHLIIAELPVFSHKWIGERRFDKVIDRPPIASGPYRIASDEPGRSITYAKRPDYWARDLNTRRGMFNFGRITYQYYRDRAVSFEAFKAGQFDFRFENHSKRWARDYTGPAFTSGRIIRRELPHHNDAGMQGFMFNLRRSLFSDRRVRRAINLAFDFPWANHHLFYDQYKRCTSYFSNSKLAARPGKPTGAVRALLERHRDVVPPTVFQGLTQPPTTTGAHDLRDNLLRARELLRTAGWRVDDDGVLRNASGRAFRFEFLLTQKGFERILAPFFRNLRKLGMRPEYRTVDPSIYQQRVRSFNFDMAVMRYAQSQSPGNELRSMFGSDSAQQQGSRNYIGIASPAVDAMVQAVIDADDRRERVIAARALDRVLMYGQYMVPNWFIDVHRVAYRDIFGVPRTLPLYYQPDIWMVESWWLARRDRNQDR